MRRLSPSVLALRLLFGCTPIHGSDRALLKWGDRGQLSTSWTSLECSAERVKTSAACARREEKRALSPLSLGITHFFGTCLGWQAQFPTPHTRWWFVVGWVALSQSTRPYQCRCKPCSPPRKCSTSRPRKRQGTGYRLYLHSDLPTCMVPTSRIYCHSAQPLPFFASPLFCLSLFLSFACAR